MMKINKLLSTIFILTLLVTLNTLAVSAQTTKPPDINEDKVVIGQTFILQENQTLNGELAVIGGTAILRSGSLVTGDVAVIGGALQIDGTVDGNIQAVGGSIDLRDTAVIRGTLYNYSSNLSQADGAVIEGQQVSSLPFNFNFGNFSMPNPPQVNTPTISRGIGFIGQFLWSLLQIIAMGALAMLVVLIAPKSTDRIARSIAKQPFVHWGIGLLSAFAIPALLLVLFITIILIPLGLIGVIVAMIAILYGWFSLGYVIGKRLFEHGTGSYSPALLAGLGTIILSAVARLAAEIPCVGWLVGATLAMLGMGAIILTRFGTRDYLYYNNTTTQIRRTPAINVQNEPEAGTILANIEADILDDEDFDDDEEEDENQMPDSGPKQDAGV